MKKILLAVVLMFSATMCVCQAQTQKDINNERQAIKKLSKKELGDKASKVARKEAKKLRKDGWLTMPGALPLDKQLDKSYLMQMEYDEDLFPKYIMAEAASIGENYDAAKLQAMELSKINLAGQIQSEITVLIENAVANSQLKAEEAASVVKVLAAGKTMITQSIGRVIPVMECYRSKNNKNKEVLVRIAYNSKMAKEAAKRLLREELNDQTDELHKKLDEIMGWNKN